jgi:site-specific recombinase XerD
MNDQKIIAQRIFLKGFSTGLFSYVENFLLDRQVTGCRPRTLDYYREKLDLFLTFCDSMTIDNLEQLTASELREFIRRLQVAHNPGGVAAIYRAVKAFLHWVELETNSNWQNPCRRVKMPRVDLLPLEPAEFSEVQLLLATTKGKTISSLRDRAIILFLSDTGCRATEMLSIDRTDYDIVTGQATIRESKNRRPRFAFCNQLTRRAFRDYLQARQDKSPALFVNKNGDRLKYDGLRALLVRRSEMAGLGKTLTAHQFRRFFALETLRAGADTVTVARLLGHSNLATVERYLRQTTGDLSSIHSKTSPVNKLK